MKRPPTPRRADTAKPLQYPSLFPALCLVAGLWLGAAPARAEEPPPPPDPPARQTGPVVVTATRAERDALDVPGNTSVIDRKAIEKSGAQTLPDLLRRQAGLYVTNFSSNLTGTNVEARGFNNGGALGSSLLVLVDGRRVNEADTGNTDWALLPLDQVDRIEIVRGPASATHGDNAVAGIIHIFTRRQPGPPRAVLSGSGGSWSTARGSLLASAAAGPVHGSLFVGGHHSDGYRERSDYEAKDVNGNVELQLGEKVAWGVGGAWHEDVRNLPGFLTEAEKRSLGRRAADPASAADRAEVNRGAVQSWIEAQLAEGVVAQVQPWYSQRNDDVVLTFLTPGGPSTTTLDFDKASIGADAQIQIDRSIASMANRLILGGALLFDETDRNIQSDFGPLFSRNQRGSYAVFVQNELNLTEDLLVSGGLRFDAVNYRLRARDDSTREQAGPDFDIWSPKAAITYRIFAPLAAYFAYAKGFRLPNFDENAPGLPFLPGGDTLIPDLRPQRSESFEIGSKWESERLSGALAFYLMKVRNEITLDPFTGANENFDRVRHRGIELSLAAQLLSWLQLYGSYTLEDAQIREYDENPAFEGKRMPINPLHRGTVGLFATLPGGVEGRINANLVGERFLSNDFANAERRLSPYAVVDVWLGWRPPLERLLGEWSAHVDTLLHFGVRNLGNEKYSEFGSFSLFSDPVFAPAPARGYEGGLRVTLRR